MREAEAKLERKKLELMERIEKEKCDAVREAHEAETAKHEAEAKIEHDKREAEELLKREELEIMERIEREKQDIERENMTLSMRIAKRLSGNRRKSAKRQSSNVRKSAKRLKGMINYFAIWKSQNWH